MRNDPRDAAVALGLFALVALFWRLRIVGPAKEILLWSGGDLYAQIYPMMHRAAEWIRAGHLPLWNPYQSCGHPFLASVLYGIFYPLNVDFLVLPTRFALEATAILHLFLAGAFTYAYAREIGVGRAAAVVSAAVFMLSGFVVGQAMWFTPAINGIVWLPVGLLAIERLCRDATYGNTLLLAAAVAMPVLAGWLQTWVYSMYAVSAYAVFRVGSLLLRATTRRRALHASLLIGAGFAIGVALAAIQLLPSAELQRLGPRRPGGLSVAGMIPMGVVWPRDLLSEAVSSAPAMPRNYVGIATLLLVPLSLVAAKLRSRVLFFWVLGAFSVLVAITVLTPVFQLYLRLPTGGWFRLPQRILFLLAFASAALAGVGFDVLAANRARRASKRLWLLAIVVTTAVALWAEVPGMSTEALTYLRLGVLFVGGALASARVRPLFLTAIVGLLVYDLFVATLNSQLHPYNTLAPYDGERQNLDFIKERQGLYRTLLSMPVSPDPALMPKMGTLREIYSITDYEPLSLSRYANFCGFLADPASPPADPFGGAIQLHPGEDQLRLLDLLSVRFIIAARLAIPARRMLEQGGWRVAFAANTRDPYLVYEDPLPLPRAYVAYGTVVADDEEKALAAVRSPAFSARAAVVLEKGAAALPAPPAGSAARAITEATITDYRPTVVAVDVHADADGYLVLTDTFYPGWRATVDGRPAEILRANYLFRAVPVPPGAHRVVFEYYPVSFAIGSIVTLATLAGIGAVPMLVRFRKRKSTGPVTPA